MAKITKKQQEQLKNLSPEIRDVAKNLFRIKQTGTAPVNLIRYEKKLGLIRRIRKFGKDSSGNKVVKSTRLVLTDKGKRILNATNILGNI